MDNNDPNPFASTGLPDDLDRRIADVNGDHEFAAFCDAEDAKRNEDDASWFSDYVRCDPDYTIDFEEFTPKPETERGVA